jgi:protein-tyrosine phosphatase
VGVPPDARAQLHARKRGYELADLRARRVRAEDFEQFDLLLAMDTDNLAELHALAPPGMQERAQLLMRYARRIAGVAEVPDPYYGGAGGFERVLDLVDDACDGLVESIARELREAGLR